VASGLLSAGPAAAALMPLVVTLASGPSMDSNWVAIAYAASICAGSSMFMWSATAGFLLRQRIDDADIKDASGQKLNWGSRQYLGYGLMHCAIQLLIAGVWVYIKLSL
ncbi:citrate transporter, partial [Nitrospirota bacterium]